MQMLAALESTMQKEHTEGGVPFLLPYIALIPEYSFTYPPEKPGPFSDASKKHQCRRRRRAQASQEGDLCMHVRIRLLSEQSDKTNDGV